MFINVLRNSNNNNNNDDVCMCRSGGDLRSHLNEKNQHNEISIKFWMAELICAVKYLHSQGIVHR
jgi:serine/threonine protein kinase